MKERKAKYFCDYCGEPIKGYRSPKYIKKYCSAKCHALSKRTYVEITCSFCGSKAEFPKNQVDRGQRKYCSRSCYNNDTLLKHRGSPSNINKCIVCGNEFESPNGRKKTCSPECHSEFHKQWVKENQNNTGEGNPFYGKKHSLETRKHLSKVKKDLFARGILVPAMKGKGDPNRYQRSKDLEWRLLASKVKERDGNKCVICGKEKRLHVHHIIPYRIIKAHTEDNLITLCKKDHEKTYGKELEFVQYFQNKLGINYDNWT